MIIEFAGLPGAGKTTIARAALADVETMGIRCLGNESLVNRDILQRQKSTRIPGKVRTLGRLVVAGIRCRRVAIDLLRCIAHTRSRKLSSLTRAASLLILLDDIKSMPPDRHDLVLLDQGLIQYVWSIFIAGDLPPDRYLRRLLTTIFAEIPLAIIFVEIDVDAAVSRIGRRETRASRFDTFAPAQAREYLSRYRVVFEKIRCWSSERPESRTLEIDGGQPVEQNVRRIIPFIMDALQGTHAAQVGT